jgi:hypothetical protein
MKLADLIPNPDVLIALEPEELGLRMLRALATWEHEGNPMELGRLLPSVVGDIQARNSWENTLPVCEYRRSN